MNNFGLNSAHAIANLLVACGVIEHDNLLSTVHAIMDGSLKLGAHNGQEKTSKETSKEEKLLTEAPNLGAF